MNHGFLRKWSKVKLTSFRIASDRRQLLQMELALALPDLLIGVEEHGRIERLLVAEIVVEQPLVGVGALGDPVDARAIQAVLAELLPRRDEDVALWSARDCAAAGAAARGAARQPRLRRLGFTARRPNPPPDRAEPAANRSDAEQDGEDHEHAEDKADRAGEEGREIAVAQASARAAGSCRAGRRG